MKVVLIAKLNVFHDGEPQTDPDVRYERAVRRELKALLQSYNQTGGMEISKDMDAVTFSDVTVIIGD